MNSIAAKDVTADYTASYAKYVATSRAIPSLVDGLKPVHRRCINSANDLKLYHDRKFLKVAKLEGQVMGDYHPHGGASMTLLAQPWAIRYPLFEGQGNFGSPDEPNSVAASRYIETRMTKFCEEFYLESADYADKEDNYDGRLKEVVRYYPPIPGVLLTSSSGIAVGLSTNIPPHRVSDVCNSLLAYIRGSSDYCDHLIPETCEESIILTPKEDIKKLYLNGEGSIQYKAKTHYESIDGKFALVVDAFPPDYSKKRLETAFILDAVEAGTLELRNESSTGIRYVFLSSDKEILDAVEERLVNSIGYRFYIEHDGKIHLYKLSELYDHFIQSRESYIVRKYSDLIKKNDAEAEFIRVLLEFKKDKEYIRSMFDKSPAEVISYITKTYDTSKEIASRIISSSLSSMMKDNAEKLQKRWDELIKQNIDYHSYVEQPIIKIVKDIQDLYSQYKSEERRAIHIDDMKDSIILNYYGETIETKPDSLFYLATKDNTYTRVQALDLINKDLTDLILVPDGFKYYVFYDKQGLIVVTGDQMSKMESKFKRDKLDGIIGTDDLSTVQLIRSHTKRVIELNEGYIRSRLSYIQQVDGDDYIELRV